MRGLLLLLVVPVLILNNQPVFAQEKASRIAYFGGISSNAPIFGVRSDAYNLRFDAQYFWLSTTIGLERYLSKTKKSAFMTRLNYQVLPHGSMSITKSESNVDGVYTRNFDSIIMKTDNVRLSIGIKHYFSGIYDGAYLQYNAGLNLIFNQTLACSCTRIESVEDNFYSETGDFSSGKRKALMPELSLTFGYVFKLNKQFAIDAGADVGMPFGKMDYPYILDKLPSESSRNKVMNLNGLFLTSLIEVHAKFLFIQ